jgi:hypothetical protein
MKYIAISLLLFSLIYCASSEKTPVVSQVDSTIPAGYKKEILDSPKVVQGTTFSKGSQLIFDADGFLRTAVLGEDQPILDIAHKKFFPHVFKKDTIIQYKEPKTTFGDPIKFPEIPKTVTTRKTVEVFGFSFGPGSTFIFPTEAKKPYLGIAIEKTFTDIEINGKKVPSGSTILLFEEKTQIRVLNKGIWEPI